VAEGRRLPFTFAAQAGVGRLALAPTIVGPLTIDKLELEVTDLGTDPGALAAERFQRRRTRLRTLDVHAQPDALAARVGEVRKHLAGLGITQLSARLNDGFVSVRARAADGLAAADVSFRVVLANNGSQVRALASAVRVHGHVPTPGPLIADRILGALLGATETPGVIERPRTRGLCDVEIDLVGALLWNLMPPSGWRLPSVGDLELVHVKIARAGIEVAYGPPGSRGELGVRAVAVQLAAAHDLMHSADAQLRDGHLEDAMRGYRALLAAGGPDQPALLERILALAAARPLWFFDGLELSRQALGRWPSFPPALAALASITLAQGDAREAASHLTQLAQLASAEGDDDQAALAALAGARLLRVLEPKAATLLYQLALEHDPTSAEAADALADRYADEQRWPELARLLRARAAASDPARAVMLRLRLADVLVHHGDDAAGAQAELAAARALAPDDPAVHEMSASLLAESDPAAAIDAWREVARLAESRGDKRTAARAHATVGALLADAPGLTATDGRGFRARPPSSAGASGEWRTSPGTGAGATGGRERAVRATELNASIDAGSSGDWRAAPDDAAAQDAWRRALALDSMQPDAIAGLAAAAARRGEHESAAELYERLRAVGLSQQAAGRAELQLARSLVALGRTDDARGSLRRATLAGGETAAEAHALLAEIAEATFDREHAAAELDTAIGSLVDLAASASAPAADERLRVRAAELAVARATLMERSGQVSLATADWERAHELAGERAPEIARDAARTMLARTQHDATGGRRWIDAVLATRPPTGERATLLVERAAARQREASPDVAAAIADLHEALDVLDRDSAAPAAGDSLPAREATELRRRAYQLEADLLARSGDRRARAQALASLAKMAERNSDRVQVETAAAAAWLAADEPAAALPHGARAHASLEAESAADVPAALRREVLTTLGEAAWRQRAWPDVLRAYRGLIDDPGADAPRIGTFRYRLAVAADRSGDAALALAALSPIVDGDVPGTAEMPHEVRGQALRLYADLAERAGQLANAARALETFASLQVGGGASARADAMYRAGELFRRASDSKSGGDGSAEFEDAAIRCLEAALKVSEMHLPALDALELAWRERGDLERVSVILGRKVAATARHPARQKPLLSRLGDLQHQLGRPDVALATHQRALEIDPTWRPSLRYVAGRLRDDGQSIAAAGGFAQLAGDLASDAGGDLAGTQRDREDAAMQLASIAMRLDDAELGAIRDLAVPALQRAVAVNPAVAPALARVRGDAPLATQAAATSEESTQSGRASMPLATAGSLALREAAARSRAAGKVADAFASLEAANHVAPGDPELRRELVDLAGELGDFDAAARHCAALADVLVGPRRGDALLELADLCYEQLADAPRARAAMRAAAEAFGPAPGAGPNGSVTRGGPPSRRRDATLRVLASEAGTHLAWDVAVEALEAIGADRLGKPDIAQLATALLRAGRIEDALALAESATATGKLDDAGALIAQLQAERARRAELDARPPDDTPAAAAHVAQIVRGVGRAHTAPIAVSELDDDDDEHGSFADPADRGSGSGPARAGLAEHARPSVTVAATAAEAERAVGLAAAAADRTLLLEAHRSSPADVGVLLALLAHLGDREPELRRDVLERTATHGSGRARAMALHELATIARTHEHDAARASALWSEAFRADPTYSPLWMPLADALAAADDLDGACELYEKVAASADYDQPRRDWARDRAAALSHDDSIVSGEIRVVRGGAINAPRAELATAQHLADAGDWTAAIAAAERAASTASRNTPGSQVETDALELLERVYLEVGDITAASEAIGRQLAYAAGDADRRGELWRRRAKLYRDALGREAEAYRCLKEAHAASPADPEVAYQLRTAAMVRGEHALAASMLYREIAASGSPRERGALHLELALIYDERLDDANQARINYEQALAFDPTIPAAKVPLAKRYEAMGKLADAARLYEAAAAEARPAERASLLDAAARCRDGGTHDAAAADDDLASQLERAEVAGDTELAHELAGALWRERPGHAAAFRVLARRLRTTNDLAGLVELTTVRAANAESADERATAWLDVARLAEELDQLDQAARAFDHALIEDPGHIAALDARGALAFKLGDLATADLIYRDLGPGESVLGDDELALRRSIIAEQLGRDDEALGHAQLAASAAPGRRDLWMRVQELATRTGDVAWALDAARKVLDLVPLDDDGSQLAVGFELVELMRIAGDVDGAIAQLDRVLRDFPQNPRALEALADLHVARGDWHTATRYLYMLVPLAPTPHERADRLYRLGEAVLVHLGDVDRADDVFLRASDLDPGHVPTLRRLLDVYWRADDPAAIVEVASELATAGALGNGHAIARSSLAQALVAAALLGDTKLATAIGAALGDEAPSRLATTLNELADRDGRLELASATVAVAELGRRGIIDLVSLRAAAADSPVAAALR
jgi:Tfp pilus assembly protein PilF